MPARQYNPPMRFDPFYFRDRSYWKNLLAIGLPIALQNLIASSLNLVDNLMVGQLGEQALGGLALANQISFLVILFTFGVSSGAAVFASQYWGAKNLKALRFTQGMSMISALLPALVFATIAATFPTAIIDLYSDDPEVIAQGAAYLQVSAFTFPLIALSFSWSMIFRSMGMVQIPLRMSVIALVINVLLTYTLIFGLFGFPALGVVGAALGTLAARFFETGGIILVAYLKKTPNAGSPGELFHFPRGFKTRFLKVSLPVLGNDIGWALGMTTLMSIYSHISTSSLAAVSIVDTIAQFLNIVIFGSVSAAAISTGNLIGAGRINRTHLLALRSTRTGFLIGLVLGLFLAVLAGILPFAFNIGSEARSHAAGLLVVFACIVPFRSLLYHQTVGLFRGAGDTRFPLLVEVGGIWILGLIPAWFAANLWHWPVTGVFAIALVHEVFLSLISLLRFRTENWIKRLHR